MTDPILKISSVTKSYGRNAVLKGIDLEVCEGQHIGLVGNNGQGKTTLIKLILGLLNADSGEIAIRGESVTAHRGSKQKQLFGYLPETVAFYPNLSGRETLRYFARLKRETKSSVEELLSLVGLKDAAGERLGAYSKGMRQRLGLAQALLGKPEILLLDEPSNGLDPSGIHEFYLTLKRLQKSGVAVLMASHLLSEVEPRLDRLALLRRGKIERFGAVDQLIAQSGLPSEIRFRLPKTQTIDVMGQGLTVTIEDDINSNTFSIKCSANDKLSLLAKLTDYENAIEGLEVRDPDLEQLFLSFNDCKKEEVLP